MIIEIVITNKIDNFLIKSELDWNLAFNFKKVFQEYTSNINRTILN